MASARPRRPVLDVSVGTRRTRARGACSSLRMIVEPEAAALAAQRRTSEHLELMSRSLKAMAVHTLGTEEGRIADREFHATLLVASDNPFLRTLTSSISTAVSWTTALKQRSATARPRPDPRPPAGFRRNCVSRCRRSASGDVEACRAGSIRHAHRTSGVCPSDARKANRRLSSSSETVVSSCAA